MIIAESDRLILRHFEEQDIESIFLLNSIPEILTYIPGEAMESIEQAKQIYQDMILENYREFGYGRWAVEHKEDKQVIGFCGPKFISEFNEVEIGYRYLPQYWGMGYAQEAGKAALAQFHQYGIEEAIAIILLGNKGSENVAKKLGLKERERNRFMGHKVTIFHRSL
ncbi:GNAT family N-acetyltransferase [Shewanella sp. UCD-KL12]|uniref:GNAT family N-acetyltransferase n=1 Tax=Shewanella sp. UCD-KL12 TaxID=1917163 RepID=UPI0015C32319|nr:GNAT family N-acetyltransferase [Shewanella sp. UCD-KL12]